MWPFTSTPAQNSAAESSAAADKCPVDHSTRAAWLAANPGAGSPFQPASGSSSTAQAFEGFTQAASSTTQDSSSSASDGLKENVIPGKRMRRLSEDRVISSIPRFSSSSPAEPEPTAAPKDSTSTTKEGEEKNWVYPSEAQFFRAMLRKHEAGVYAPTTSAPDPSDMQTIVPIHNAVNEKAWQELLKWEAGMGGEKCGGVRLVSFKGRPKERTPKAWINVALGYTAPFDRHDWVINRCGQEIRYVIDFYSGRPPSSVQTVPNGNGLPPPQAGNLSFYLDVRPALDGWEGARMRMGKLFGL